jgi:hypothetical protein
MNSSVDPSANEIRTNLYRIPGAAANQNQITHSPTTNNVANTLIAENVRIRGRLGTDNSRGIEGYTITGVGIRKYVNHKVPLNGQRGFNQGEQNWKALRYAEVLLNRAEALYELGLIQGNNVLKAKAFEDINLIRQRAGARPYTMVAAPADVAYLVEAIYPLDENLQFIRDERARELAFENHRFFDLRRWRVSHTKIRNFRVRGMLPYHILDENKYIFLPSVPASDRRQLNFNRANYYRHIPGNETTSGTPEGLIIPNDNL